MICVKCGKNIPGGAIFCCWCGKRCAEKVCTSCGTKLRSDQLFCHECGVRWEGEVSGTTEQPADGKCGNALTVFRRWQIGSDDRDFKVYVDDVELGNIGPGESLSTALFSDKVWVEIRHTSSFILTIRLRMLLKVVEQNPEISFELEFDDIKGYGYLPNIKATVSGAEILQQED